MVAVNSTGFQKFPRVQLSTWPHVFIRPEDDAILLQTVFIFRKKDELFWRRKLYSIYKVRKYKISNILRRFADQFSEMILLLLELGHLGPVKSLKLYHFSECQ